MSNNTDNSTINATFDSSNSSLQVSITFNTTASSPSGFDITTFVFRSCVITIGLLGTLLNGSVLCGLRGKVLTKQRANWLIVNQCALDLYSSAILVVTNAFKRNDPLYQGRWGDVACLLFGSEMLIWIGLEASTAELAGSCGSHVVFVAFTCVSHVFSCVFRTKHVKHTFSVCSTCASHKTTWNSHVKYMGYFRKGYNDKSALFKSFSMLSMLRCFLRPAPI